MSTFFRENRAARRHDLKIPLRVRVRRSALPEQVAESVNLSESGIYFTTGSRFREGESLDLLLKIPEQVEWRCVGHVVRVKALDSSSRALGIAVQFDRYESFPTEEKDHGRPNRAVEALRHLLSFSPTGH